MHRLRRSTEEFSTPRIHAFRPSSQLLSAQKRSKRFCAALAEQNGGEQKCT